MREKDGSSTKKLDIASEVFRLIDEAHLRVPMKDVKFFVKHIEEPARKQLNNARQSLMFWGNRAEVEEWLWGKAGYRTTKENVTGQPTLVDIVKEQHRQEQEALKI
jgi:hypothetical protein